MRTCVVRPICEEAPASVGASLSHSLGRRRYNRANLGGREFRPGRPASQSFAVPFVGGGGACRTALARRSRL